jgi:diguanylate cyclase (GGDEF)-like protein
MVLLRESYKLKLFFVLLIGVFFANFFVYYISGNIKDERIATALRGHLNDLETHYEILLYHQDAIAKAAYEEITQSEHFIEIYSQIASATQLQKELLRKQLQTLLEKPYARLKKHGVLQLHFVLPDSESFLRMHKLDKYGDNLASIRGDFKYVNETKQSVRGFTQGRTAHGFRNVFPIFGKDKIHLGAMEISFSSDAFLKNLTTISKIHAHFIVDKDIFQAKAWARDDIILSYKKSIEHESYMTTRMTFHEEYHQIAKSLEKSRETINFGIKNGRKFSTYEENFNVIEAISFLPVKNINNEKTLAWLVSYVKSDLIYTTLKHTLMVRIAFFVLFLIVGFLLYKTITTQKEAVIWMREQIYIDGLTGVYNRKKFEETLQKELSRFKRYKGVFSVAIIDIDFFKKYNDTYGHLIGDEILRMLGNYFTHQLRDSDFFARWGGEEFVLLFPETNVEKAFAICEKRRLGVASLKHPEAGSVTISIGLAEVREDDTSESIFQRCDKALYEAKNSGRNKVCIG